MSEELVEVEIGASLVSADKARDDAEDLAWDHAKFAAGVAGVEMASPEFDFLFTELRNRYLGCVEHLEYLTFNALVMLRALLASESLALTAEFPITDEKLAEILGELSHTVVSAFAWVLAGQDFLWPTNEAMPPVGVTFKFPSEDIIITQE